MVDLDEISKMTSDSVRYLVVLLVKGANDTSEAEKEIMVEMTRQFAVKAQDLKYDPQKPDFFVCDVTKVSPDVAPDLGKTLDKLQIIKIITADHSIDPYSV